MRYILLFVLSVMLGLPTGVGAITRDFSISAVVVDDMVPPSTPTLLDVTPIAATQINITWSAATDNYMIGGYVLLRDSVAIATTTLTTFSDTGLLPETLYSYEVYAFDPFYNLSSTSNALATTTLVAPVIPPVATSSTPSQSTSGTLVFKLLDFNVTTDTNAAQFAWETSKPARYMLRWGRNDAYNAGYIVNDVYRVQQQTGISDLEPGTVYLYELVGYDATGKELVLRTGEFRTVARESLVPANVQFFTATVAGNDVQLDWVLPSTAADARVRIVRNYLGYPTDPYDGAVVYEGEANTFFDQGALAAHDTMYYTAFVFAADGSVSSGAVLRAVRQSVGEGGGSTASTTGPIAEEELPLPGEIFAATQILFVQGDTTFNFRDAAITLKSDEPFLLSIPYDTLPKHLKSIIVTLSDPTDSTRTYSFLLRINKDRTAYEATVAPLATSGVSQFQVEIFEYEQRVMARYLTPVTFVAAEEVAPEVLFPDKIVEIVSPFLSILSLLLLLILFLIFFIYKRSSEAEDKP